METTSAATAASLPASGLWTLERNHATVGFRVIQHAYQTFRSSFGDVDARYDAASRRLTASARVKSIQTFEMLRNRLFEADFFDADNHPEITFVSTSIEDSGGEL